jgi:glutathione-regulated potassium-efflux system ancillary protein KefG
VTQRVLVLFAHPAFHRSRVQRALWSAARDVPGVTVHDVYEAYPDFDIDVPHEQALLSAHDVIVWQHPLFWYSTPAIVKQWEDLVLEHGWAYGRDGRALHGKTWVHALSAGGGEAAYTPEGRNRHTIAQMLAPLAQTARLCGMTWLPPYVVHGTHVLDAAALTRHAVEYGDVLAALRDGRLDETACAGHDTINAVVASAGIANGTGAGTGPASVLPAERAG